MKLDISPLFIKRFIGILFLLLLVKLLWFFGEVVWFPVQGVNHAEGKKIKPLYYRVQLTPNESQAPQVKKPVVVQSSIKDITLLAVYHASDNTVITVQYKGKTKVLARGEAVNGFVLKDAGSQFAVFEKNGKEYRVVLLSLKNSASKYTTASAPVKEKSENVEVAMEGVVDVGDHKIVDRSLIKHYTKDMKSIYKDIGIQDVKQGNQIDGFRVTFVRRGTPFSKLGLQRGDILKSINGQELNSYNAAFEAYRNINDATDVTLVIQRGKKEMELEYEIN